MFPRLPPPPPPRSPLPPWLYRPPRQSPWYQRKVHTCTCTVVYYTPQGQQVVGLHFICFDPSASQSVLLGFFSRQHNFSVADSQNVIKLCSLVFDTMCWCAHSKEIPTPLSLEILLIWSYTFGVIECTLSNKKDISVLEPLCIISENMYFNCVNGHIRKKYQFVDTWGMEVDSLFTSFCKSDRPNSAKI